MSREIFFYLYNLSIYFRIVHFFNSSHEAKTGVVRKTNEKLENIEKVNSVLQSKQDNFLKDRREFSVDVQILSKQM